MRFFCCLGLLLCIAGLSACVEKSITGIYRNTFENGTFAQDVKDNECNPPHKLLNDLCVDPYEGENLLGIYQNDNGDIDFAAALSFFNGHSCGIEGHAVKHGKGWLFESKDENPSCKLIISIEGEAIVFTVPEDADCSFYCGARGSLDGSFFSLSDKINKPVSGKDDLDCVSSMETPCVQQENKE